MRSALFQRLHSHRVNASLLTALLAFQLVATAADATLNDLGTVTFDDATGLDWLDLTQSVGLPVDWVLSGTSNTFLADGWRYATTAEVCALLTAALVPPLACPGTDPTASATDAAAFIGLFGDTTGTPSARGIYDSGTTNYGEAEVANPAGASVVVTDSVIVTSAFSAFHGHFLVRDHVVSVGSAGDLLVGRNVSGLSSFDPVTGVETVVTPSSTWGVAFEPGGTVVFTSNTSNGIKRVDLSTSAVTVVNNTLQAGGDIQVASNGDLYVSQPSAIYKVNPSSGVATVVSSGGMLVGALGIGFDPSVPTDLLVANAGNGTVIRVDTTTGNQTPAATLLDSGGEWAVDVVVAANGDLFVTSGLGSSGQARLYRVSSGSGTQVVLAFAGDVGTGLALEPGGDLLMGTLNNGLNRIDPTTFAVTQNYPGETYGVAIAEASRFCLSGTASGSDWSWRIDANPIVTIPGLTPGSTSAAIASAFAASISANAPVLATASVIAGKPECFGVSYVVGFTFEVGPSGSIDCTITGNPLGCTFNPTLIEERFITQGGSVPAMPAAILIGLAAALAAVVGSQRIRTGSPNRSR